METWAALYGEAFRYELNLFENMVASTRQHVFQDSCNRLQIPVDLVYNVRLGKPILMLHLEVDC